MRWNRSFGILSAAALLIAACGTPTNEGAAVTSTTDTLATTSTTPPSPTTTTIEDGTTTTAAGTTSTSNTTTTVNDGDSESHRTLDSAPESQFPPFVREHADDIKSTAEQVDLAAVAPLHPHEGFDWSIADSSFGTLPGAYSYDLIAADRDSPTEYLVVLRVARNSPGLEEELKADGWIEAVEVSLSEGFTTYWLGMGEQIEFMVVPEDLDFTVTLGVHRACEGGDGEEEFAPGICLTWSDVEGMVHGLGVIE